MWKLTCISTWKSLRACECQLSTKGRVTPCDKGGVAVTEKNESNLCLTRYVNYERSVRPATKELWGKWCYPRWCRAPRVVFQVDGMRFDTTVIIATTTASGLLPMKSNLSGCRRHQQPRCRNYDPGMKYQTYSLMNGLDVTEDPVFGDYTVWVQD